VSAIWRNDGSDWRLLAPTGFPDEAALHRLVEEAPHLLPLSGSPNLVVVGREVQLGGGYADLVAVEPTGRLVLIEVKLARNSEARRAVIAQVLSYAAALHGTDAADVEEGVLADHLRRRGYASLASALAANDQDGSFDDTVFSEGLADSLRTGSFRVVLVLDDAPPDLVRLVGYLEAISSGLVVDLVTVGLYEAGGERLLVPRRVEPGRETREPAVRTSSRPAAGGIDVEGADDFRASIDEVPEESRPPLLRLYEWAMELDRLGLARLITKHDVRGWKILRPLLAAEGVGLVTLWNDGRASIQLWRSVFERRAPESLARVEALIGPLPSTTRDVTEDLLDALTDAYREATESAGAGRFDWSVVSAAIEAIPAGRWTTYGDLAEIAGTAAIAVGRYVASVESPPGAHRVLGADGKVRPDFRWTDPDDTRDIFQVLREEGVGIGPSGAADPAQRLHSNDLRELFG
jgi:alkylated DNA nucleotide flippase Atl1